VAETVAIRLGWLGALVVALVGLVEPAAAQTPIQDRCLVCHLAFKKEDLAVTHLKAARAPAFEAGDLNCEYCHGDKNDPHRADEDGLTPPQKMFDKADIVPFCTTADCHPKHSDAVSAADLKAQVCTECHGAHKMKVRTRLWDKKTGKLTLEK